jgi:hypothetical protein
MRSLKVTAILDSPLAGDAPMLDAILEWVNSFKMGSIQASGNGHRHRLSQRPRGLPVESPGKIPIPVARRFVAGYPIPLCSSPVLASPFSESVEHITKALAIEEGDLLSPGEWKIVTTTGGAYKSYRLPLRMRAVERVVWFCVGQGTRIRHALKRVSAIGKKTADGYGRVGQWLVEEAADDWSWFVPDGERLVLMRPMPAGDYLPDNLAGYRKWYGAPCGPYWQRDLYCDLVVPC